MTSKGLMTVSTNKTLTQQRHETAEAAIAALGSNVAAHEVLVVQCPRSHHLGQVIDTSVGPILRSVIGPHSHGRRDLPDVAHHADKRGREQLTMLEPASPYQTSVAAWCDCGTRTVELDAVREALRSSLRTLHVE